jgi:hypothetical protein
MPSLGNARLDERLGASSVLVTRGAYLSFRRVTIRRPNSGSLYNKLLCIIAPFLRSFHPIHSRKTRPAPAEQHAVPRPSTHRTTNQRGITSTSQQQAASSITTSGSVVTTNSRIAAASARALPARAVHLSDWTGSTGFARRSAPAPAPSTHAQHTLTCIAALSTSRSHSARLTPGC